MVFLIKSTSILSLFYFFYFIFLQKDTFFNSIRFYFLTGVLSSIIIPFITIRKYIFIEVGQAVNIIESSLINNSAKDVEITLLQILGTIYFVGVFFLFIKFLVQLSSILWFIYSNKKEKLNGITFIKTSRNITPFSFFNFVVYNPIKFEKEELKPIIAHEKVHVNQLQSLDHLLSQFLVIFNWFNPFVWLFAKEIQINLEFIADNIAQETAPKTKDYQQLLLKTISPNYHLALTTNFYNSIIKKRIDMLQKNRTNKSMHLKFALIIPILIGFILTFNVKVIAQQIITKSVEVQSKIESEIITKDFSKTDLEKLKSRLAPKGIKFSYKKLKFNSYNEIIGIQLAIDNKKGSKSNISLKSDDPIKPISININTKNGEISMGNIKDDSLNNMMQYGNTTSSNKNKMHVSVKNYGKTNINTSSNGYVFISDDESKDGEMIVFVNSKNNNGNTFVTSGKGHDNKYKIIVKTDSLSVNSEKGESNIWIVKKDEGDKGKKIKIVELNRSERDGKTHRVIIETNGDTTSEKIILNGKKVNVDNDILFVESDDASQFNKSKVKFKNLLFIESNDKSPLIYVNEKEMKGGSINEIDPNMIMEVTVLKGKAATEKYGEKAKDGVILIKTKK